MDISDSEEGRALGLPDDSFVHAGIWHAACAVKRALEDSRVLERVRYGSPSRSSSSASGGGVGEGGLTRGGRYRSGLGTTVTRCCVVDC